MGDRASLRAEVVDHQVPDPFFALAQIEDEIRARNIRNGGVCAIRSSDSVLGIDNLGAARRCHGIGVAIQQCRSKGRPGEQRGQRGSRQYQLRPPAPAGPTWMCGMFGGHVTLLCLL